MRRHLLLLILAGTLAACAGGPGASRSPLPSSAPTPPPSPSPTPTPTEALGGQLLLRLDYQGGFVAPESQITRLPMLSLYVDGTLIEMGATPAIYPGPILPALLASRLNSAALEQIMTAVAAAGITQSNQSYPARGTADAPNTVITARGPHGLITTSLGLASPNAQLDPAEAALRARVNDLLRELADWRSYLGPLAPATGDLSYRPSALRIWITAPIPGTSPSPTVVVWPLSGKLADFGAPTAYQFEPLRCATVSGPDLELLWPVLRSANQNTLFSDGISTVRLLLRPLLPDEPASCRKAGAGPESGVRRAPGEGRRVEVIMEDDFFDIWPGLCL